MCRLQAAGGHFGQHRGKKQRVGLTDERECNTWIAAKFFLQVHGRAHPRETAAEDDDARFYLWRYGLGRCRRNAEQTLGQPNSAGREQSQGESEKQPADKRRKERAHTLGRPLRRLASEQREKNNV